MATAQAIQASPVPLFRPAAPPSVSPEVAEVLAHTPRNTQRTYRWGLNLFTAWCASHGRQSLPATPETVAEFLVDAARSYRLTSLDAAVAAVAAFHVAAGIAEPPTRHELVRRTRANLRRLYGAAQPLQKAAPADMAAVTAMLGAIGGGVRGVRDRAMLLVGFAGALRSADLAALDLGDLTETEDGVVVHVRASKANQTGGKPDYRGLPYSPNPLTCPVRAWRAWAKLLAVHGYTTGPAWRVVTVADHLRAERMSTKAVWRAVSRYAAAAGLSPGEFASWSSHSLRAGLATAAAAAGVPDRVIAEQGGWASLDSVRGYVRHGSLWTENAAAAVLR